MQLRDIAHSRTGDKGNTSNISLIAYRAEDYPTLLREITAAKVAAFFASVITGPVERYEMPGVLGLNFVLHGALGGGVTRSLALDAHGKSLGSALLAMEI